jgi:kynurenine formamidase
MAMGIAITGSEVIDLSQAISAEIPVPVGVPAPRVDEFLSQEKGDVANVEILAMGVHAGTHVDAPYHFFSDLQRVDELPPDCLIGPAVVVDMTDKEGSVAIEAADLWRWESAAGEAIRPDDIVLLHTGHSKNWRRGEAASAYWENGWPHLARSAVDYLASKPIRAIGVESFDPDWVDLGDLKSAEFPTHRTFLPKGILVIENLTNLDLIPGTRCCVIALPLKIEGASGSPLRVVAIV